MACEDCLVSQRKRVNFETVEAGCVQLRNLMLSPLRSRRPHLLMQVRKRACPSLQPLAGTDLAGAVHPLESKIPLVP